MFKDCFLLKRGFVGLEMERNGKLFLDFISWGGGSEHLVRTHEEGDGCGDQYIGIVGRNRNVGCGTEDEDGGCW